jgi:hypothetical protein
MGVAGAAAAMMNRLPEAIVRRMLATPPHPKTAVKKRKAKSVKK